MIQAIDQNGHTRSYEYNDAHRLTRYTDRTGRGQNIRYDSTEAKAKAVAEWVDDGSFKTRLEWHPRLRQVAVYDAYDVPTYYYFDLDGFTYRTRLADGREKWLSRDSQKCITRQIDFAGLEIEQVYNDQEQLIKIVQQNGGIIRFAYDELGNLSKTIRPEGQVQSDLIYGSGHIYGFAFNKQNKVAFQRDDLHRETVRMLAKGLVQTKNNNDVGLLSSQIIRPEQETANQYNYQNTKQNATTNTTRTAY